MVFFPTEEVTEVDRLIGGHVGLEGVVIPNFLSGVGMLDGDGIELHDCVLLICIFYCSIRPKVYVWKLYPKRKLHISILFQLPSLVLSPVPVPILFPNSILPLYGYKKSMELFTLKTKSMLYLVNTRQLVRLKTTRF